MSEVAIAGDKIVPLFLVRGKNWLYEVASDPEDLGFTLEEQAVEAATKAVEFCEGIHLKEKEKWRVPNKKFELDKDHDAPVLGLAVEVFLLNTDQDISFFVYTFLALGNGGFYKHSAASHQALILEIYESQKSDKNLSAEMHELFKQYQKKGGKSVTFKPKGKKKK